MVRPLTVAGETVGGNIPAVVTWLWPSSVAIPELAAKRRHHQILSDGLNRGENKEESHEPST
jgi:hypothetical protein